jgi:hypothetical protein
MWRHVKSGAWLTRERVRAYPLILIAISVAATVVWIALADGLVDRNGKPIGTDFSSVYAAGTLVLDGEPSTPYDLEHQHAAEKRAFGGREVPLFGWHYPPTFLLVAAALALLPYGWALAAWMALTLPAYLLVIRRIVPRPETALVALAFPAVYVNLAHGQNGFLSAALLGGSLLVLDRRPKLAGVLIGLLAYKPQFGVLIPIALLAGGRWRTMGAAAATVAALVAVSFALLGSGIWHAFADSMNFTQTVVLEQGGTGWQKIQSIFSGVRAWGASVPVAYAAQATLFAMLAASIAWLWHSDAAFELKAAALALGSLLATPYVLDYDFVVLAVAIAFFVRHGLRHGFRDFEISLLAAAWIVPLLSRSIAGATLIPLGLFVELALFAFVLRRAALDRASHAVGTHRVAQA